MINRRHLRCETLEARHVLDSVVVFNEIMYNPTGADESREWIELHNQMAIDIDLSKWRLSGGVNFTFAEGTIIPGHGYLVVASDPAALQAASGFGDALGPYEGQLGNSGETLRLLDRNDRQLDEITYGDEGDWPVGADGSGASLAKINPDSISDQADKWAASPQIGGTPGERNFPTSNAPSTSQTLVAPDSFWHYDASGTDNGTAWRNPGYVLPPAWSAGPALIRAGDAQVTNPGSTVVSGVTATASTEYTPDGRLAIKAANGSGLSGSIHSATTSDMWLTVGAADTSPQITFDLGQVYKLDSIRVWNYNEYRPDLPTRVAELLGRGVARANILVAGADQQFTPFLLDHTFPLVTAATTATDFSQTLNFGGQQARYVRIVVLSNHNGKDYTNPASNDPYGNYVGLSEVQFRGVANPFNTDVPLGATTYYFRNEFGFAADPARTQLFLNTTIDDGAVFYLNGVEVYRQNMPGGDPTYDTLASNVVGNAAPNGPITIPAGSLIQGPGNVLAVEVHQAAASGDADMVFGADLTAVIAPVTPGELNVPLVFNEVDAGASGTFFVELANRGASAINVGGYVIQSTSGAEHVLPAGTLNPGGLLAVNASQLGFTPVVGDRLFLLTPSRALLGDAAEVKTTIRGRLSVGTGVWAYPDVATPGAANSVLLHDEIVINEIMYNHRPTYATPPTPATFQDTTLIPINASWKFNRQGTGQPAGWPATNFTVDGTLWRNGTGLIGRETTPAALPATIGTDLSVAPLSYVSSTIAYYFQKEFTFAGAPAGATVRMRYVVDDGAIFYLNGVEIAGTRFLMPAGAVTGTTQALSPGVDNAAYSSYFDIPVNLLNVGNNIISAEVHQLGTGSSDIVFGMELVVSQQVTPPIPGTSFIDNPEEWIELYNKSDHAVDLSGWRLDDAVDFTFADGTTIAPHAYLVVAGDADALAAEYPEISIAGEFSGALNDQDDRIRLRDARGNTADEVHYFDGGRWSDDADGGGSSLELRDPNADNSSPEAWAASDESGKSQWQTITYRGQAGTSAVGSDATWNELVMGMLDEGEILIDDIRVTQMTGVATPTELLQNGTFEGDTAGGAANKWRIIGNHSHSQVIVDPTNPANKVLRLVAGGMTDHMSNHAETTLKNGATFVAISAGSEYEISFRAKWVSGSPQFNTRLYFNRLARTTILSQPTKLGTPGAANSRSVVNAGPTYEEFRHSPAVPAPFEPVTVTAVARDPDGVASMTVWYSIAGGAWQSAPMTLAGGRYQATLPGQAASTVVQFYVEGQDALGATSTFPADGRDARALYKVNDGMAATNGLNNFRIVVTATDGSLLHNPLNLMSNDRIGATVIYNENEVFYDVGVRLKGSEHSRVNSQRLGFNVSFNSDQLFRGFHKTVALDRSESTFFGQREVLVYQTMNHAGGILSKYNDLIQVMAPLAAQTGAADLQMARYGDEFLDEQFSNGSDGTVFEYELVYRLTTTNDGTPEGQKVYTDADGALGVGITNLGDDAERYRYTYLIKNNTEHDDFAPVVAWAKVMGLTGTAFTSQIGNYIDVDQWLRGFALSVTTGAGDSYGGDGSQHNVQFYVRPEDGKVMFFPHDLDAFLDANRSATANGDLQKLLTVPANAHNYYGHLQDIIATTYNTAYMTRWANHFGQLLPAQPFASHLAFIGQRSAKLLNDINTAAGTQAANAFDITSPAATVNSTVATISGKGWVNVRTIRLAGDPLDLPITWNTITGWQATVPVAFGTNPVTLEAYDFQGNLIGSDTVSITSTVSARPLQDFLRITEFMYHPADPSLAEQTAGFNNADDFEYVELRNISTDTPLNLAGVRFVNGIAFDFTAAGLTSLAPGQYAVIASNPAAFAARYGAGIANATGYTGQLNNAGETIRLEDSLTVVIQQFTYDDSADTGWYPSTDGEGYSLVDVDPTISTPDWSAPTHWRPSTAIGGSPGRDDTMLGDFDANGRIDLADLAILQRHLGTTSGGLTNEGDMNGDGAINRADAALFASRYGRTSGGLGDSPAAASAAIVAVAGRNELHAGASRRAVAAIPQRRARQVAVDEVFSQDASMQDAAASDLAGLRASRSRATVRTGQRRA